MESIPLVDSSLTSTTTTSTRCRRFLQPGKPSPLKYQLTVVALILYSVLGGYYAGTSKSGSWSFFSWHPFLMVCGLVGMVGISAMTKKLGGYDNTKVSTVYGTWYISRLET